MEVQIPLKAKYRWAPRGTFKSSHNDSAKKKRGQLTTVTTVVYNPADHVLHLLPSGKKRFTHKVPAGPQSSR
jgi:hypothetical protein